MTDPAVWSEFAVRMAGTAFIVVMISWIAARLGPSIGGVVVGLPIVLAPGLGFMLFDQSPEFVSQASAGALFSLCATQAFLLAFVALARGNGPFRSVAGGALAWLMLALPLGMMPHNPLVGAVLFAIVTLLARRLGRRLISGQVTRTAGTNWGLLVLRGLLAGLLVGAVTLGASALGAGFSGAIMAFPIGFTVIAISLHLDHGGDFAGQTAYAGLNGLSSLATFCFCLALFLVHLPAGLAFAVALAASVLATVIMAVIAGRKGRSSHGQA
ncbi:MAG: hypothetical protein ACU0B7_15720 [Paracoccaceae bacterium]|uniref:hypothetical protein n=1 Tax=Seohaeicola saemankumensis TaxID=481181 RepID=UPI001E2B2A81|nr:hypothetical protein [Seohaeicola saemankumensis]MCD1626657.1 hypothetical protein [Seohaeicola saemankumensis]